MIGAYYYGSIRISDGIRSEYVKPDVITCRNKDGTFIKLRTEDGKWLKEFNLPKGRYEINIQREYAGGQEQSRKVKD